MRTTSLDYELSPDRIAGHPTAARDQARLLVDAGPGRPPEDRRIADLGSLLAAGDVVVLNDTRVRPARLAVRRRSGGTGEVLLLERDRTRPGWWEALVRPSRRLRSGERVDVVHAEGLAEPHASTGSEAFQVLIGEDLGRGRRLVRLELDTAPTSEGERPRRDAELDALERWGALPLPPYLPGPAPPAERYQTVYARHPGSVAAPTAGLHLTDSLLDELRAGGAELVSVTLDIGLGTFRPIASELVEDHEMHEERYTIPAETVRAVEAARRERRRIVAVGTTSLRALESWALTGRREDRTSLFIRRPFDFALVDALLTNFHQPRSSLLALVDAFVGPRWRSLYDHALASGYRFLSFGDASFLLRSPAPGESPR